MRFIASLGQLAVVDGASRARVIDLEHRQHSRTNLLLRRVRPRLAMSKGHASQTPVMRQYLTAKAAHPDALLFFRDGATSTSSSSKMPSSPRARST